MWRVTAGNKIRNVKDGDKIKIFNAGEILPADYIPHETYIQQKVVEEVKDNKGGKK